MEIFKLFGSVLVNTSEAESSISKVDSKASKFAQGLGGGIKTAAKWGAGLATAAAGAATAVVGALLQIDEATKEYRENQAKLTTAWESAGKTAAGAKEAYTGFYEILGDHDAATETSQLLASLVENEQDIVDWTDIAAGAYGRFGDALPINSLVEASNETQKTGQLTGTLADAINWAGLSEEDFQAKLDSLSTEQERNQFITETLYELYGDSASAFYENSQATLKARDAELVLMDAMAKLGGAVETVKTKLLSEFAPSIAAIVSSFVDFTNGVDGAEVALQESIQNMVDQVVQKLPEFLEFGIQIIVAIAKGIVQNLPYLLEQVPGLVLQIAEAFLDLGGELENVGKELLDMLWDGMLGVWDDVSSWVSSKVSWLADKLMFWRDGQDEMRSSPNGSHASGLPYVPYDGYKAVLHRGETVLNASNTADLLDRLNQVGGGQSSAPIVINLTAELDGAVLSRKMYRYNQAEGRIHGGSLVEV